MVFASYVFLFWFLPLVLLLHTLAPRRWRNAALTLASLVFYGWWRPDYVLLVLTSTLVDWAIARRMGPREEGRPHRRSWLVLSLLINLGLLGWFKYANLLVDSCNQLLEAFGRAPIPWHAVLLPVGISFYTFQTLSYTVDVYRGEVRPVRSLVDFACFVTMFPQLVAGPIVRYRDIAGELHDRRPTWAAFGDGVTWFGLGFAKKVLIADNAALLVAPVFGPGAPGLAAAWCGVLAYSVQIYFDFSGYSDMAIGLGKMLGFTFPENFRSPYRSRSVTEFWRRWHMSLSSWLRDYLYVPLGGNRGSTERNLMLTMLLGGLWHGAAWTYLIWGGYQGLWLVLERRCGKRALWAGLPLPLQVACTFVVTLFGWAVFRAADLGQLGAVWWGMLGGHGAGHLPAPPLHAIHAWSALAVGLLLAWFGWRVEVLVARARVGAAWLACAVFVPAVGQLLSRGYTPFLYFQF